MTGGFALWWSSPFTAALVAVAVWVLLATVTLAAAAVVRFGSLQLAALLANRESLLPGLPRRGDTHDAVVLTLVALAGAVAAVFAAASLRAALLGGLGSATGVLAALVGWCLAVAAAAVTARSALAEIIAESTVTALRPVARLVRLLIHEEKESDDEDAGGEDVDDHEVQAFIDVGEEAGIIEREDVELITSIVELSDTVAREIMTPRTDIVALPVTADFATLRATFADSMYTRIPLFRETLDKIEGLLHVKDVVKAMVTGAQPSAGELLRQVLLVPETKPLRELLREFQTSRQQLAVVVDEYGGTSGIVTLEDVLEEIVGEIQDEHQRERPEVEQEASGTYLVEGGAHVEVLEELFGLSVGDVGFDSVAGLVLDRLGHLPRAGETITWHGIEFEAVEVDRRRLRRVRVRRPA